ncbi:MAG: MATE family efflux transporter [Fibrobacteria bacterium]|nr:MATE family efflux transporter [Fibrobacteria bacterium]
MKPVPRRHGKSLHDTSLLSLAWPVSVTMAVGISQPLLDSWFLSRLSDAAAAGVGAMVPVFAASMILLNTFGQAGASIAGQYLGAGNHRKAHATWALLLGLLTGMGVVVGALLTVFAGPVCRAMGLDGEILDHGEIFLRVLGTGMVGRALWSGTLNILASLGMTRWNLWAALVVVGVNTLLNLLFLGYGGILPSMGTYGVALATTLSWAVVSFLLLGVLARKVGWLPSWKDAILGWRHQRLPMARIGIPSAIEPISYQFFLVVIGSQVVRLGEIPLTARVFAANLANIPVIFSYGAGFAAQIMVAHLVGGRKFDQADRQLRKALLWGGVLTALASLTVAVTATWTLGLFTQSREILALGATLLWIDLILQPAKCGNIALTFCLRSSGDSRFPAVVGTSLMWSLGMGACMGMAFGFGWGVVGIWGGMALDEWVRSLVNWKRWSGGRWRTKGVAVRGNQQSSAED